MKHKGSISQAYLKRDTVVISDIYRRAKAVAEYPTTMRRLFEIAANLPVSQFYIPDDAALSYIRRRVLRGTNPVFVNPYKQKLYEALYELVSMMMKEERYAVQGLASTTIIALSRPAPCVGLSPKRIQKKLKKIQKNNRQ